MSFETLITLHDTAIELNRKPCAAGIEEEGECTRKTVPFGMIRKDRQPPIQVVHDILKGSLSSAVRRRLAGQPME